MRDAGDCSSKPEQQERRIEAVAELAKSTGVKKACDALCVSRAYFYREKSPGTREPKERSSVRALTAAERDNVKQLLYSERFMDKSPSQIYAQLLDEGLYYCSTRTMYRILERENAVKERRNQLRRPNYTKPELLASAPNQVWSWDITKLKGPEKWTSYQLYVILDVFSRCVVGWMIAHQEQANLAVRLIRETIEKQNVPESQLTIHSDRGPSMTSHSVAQLMASLGVTKSHSRPHVSNDNPFSESQFKTLKYHPDFPNRFGSFEDARSFCQSFFTWYNEEHYHSSIGYVTPASLHYGQAAEIIVSRAETLKAAYVKNPARFVRGMPKPRELPTEVWINPPLIRASNQRKELPEINCSQKPLAASLTHRRFDYPSTSCVPAELASVSSNQARIANQKNFEHPSHASENPTPLSN